MRGINLRVMTHKVDACDVQVNFCAQDREMIPSQIEITLLACAVCVCAWDFHIFLFLELFFYKASAKWL